MLEAVLIAGANGAGKTSFAREILPVRHPGVEFLNVDEIQLVSRFANPIAAGREVLKQLAEREAQRSSFAIETTLSSVMYARHISRWKQWGYLVFLYVIEVPSEEVAIARVAKRVATGGT